MVPYITYLIGPHAASCRGKDLVIFARASVAVVFTMCDSPTVIGDKQSTMANGADNIVGKLAVGKALMATLMCQDPYSCHYRPLRDPIYRPQYVW